MIHPESDHEQRLIKNSVILSKHLVLYRYRAQKLAQGLITDQGKINSTEVESLLKRYTSHCENHDRHIANILTQLKQERRFVEKILQFDLPIHPEFEKIIRLTLDLPEAPLTPVLLRKAVLAALFGYLRQTVGSCFATAPCLYVLDRHPDYFLEDLLSMSKKGAFQRLVNGQVLEVPMALSIGEHFIRIPIAKEQLNDSVFYELKKTKGYSASLEVGKTLEQSLGKKEALCLYTQGHDPILKIWEYTVASLCDAKGEFSESTLYLILGLDSKIPDGLGHFFYENFQKKLDEQNEKLNKTQGEAFLTQQRLAMAETLAKNATSEAAFHRSKSEIIAANYQLQNQSFDIDDIKKEQKKIQNLYEKNAHLLKELIPQFFQESYDPDLVSMRSEYDDSPAGFRLFIKEGLLSSRFKAIHTEEDFSRALKKFFEHLESALIDRSVSKETLPIITDFITQTIQFSTSKEFLEQTLKRAQKRHPHALPWAYISGGTLETLLKTYFRKEIIKSQKIKGDTLFVLFVELIEYFKMLPEHHLAPFRGNPHLGLLLETKTHACQLQPGREFFRHFWESSGFTYSEVRDHLLTQGKNYYEEKGLNQVIPGEFFKLHHRELPSMRIRDFLASSPNTKEAFFIASSYLIGQEKQDPERTLGFCALGDTNWTFNTLIVGYHPLHQELTLFAQDPVTLGLLTIDNQMQTPVEWKIYEDLSRIELFISGIRI